MRRMRKAWHVAGGVLALAAAFWLDGASVAAQSGEQGSELTYARDVAPIIQEKCQECHMRNSIGPFSLTTYDEVRRYGRRIRDAVSDRIMPPWHLNRTVGIQEFKNDRGLTDEQIHTIVAWIDGGMARGNDAELPAPREFPDYNQWQFQKLYGEPDLVVASEPFTLDAA